MRETKFRAWDTENKKFIRDFAVYETGTFIRFLEEGDHVEHLGKRYHVVQYTGLKDKNGKEIYEGDIVKLEKFGEGVKILKVYVDKWGVFPFRETTFSGEGGAEIIGNIYENSDLLK